MGDTIFCGKQNVTIASRFYHQRDFCFRQWGCYRLQKQRVAFCLRWFNLWMDVVDVLWRSPGYYSSKLLLLFMRFWACDSEKIISGTEFGSFLGGACDELSVFVCTLDWLNWPWFLRTRFSHVSWDEHLARERRDLIGFIRWSFKVMGVYEVCNLDGYWCFVRFLLLKEWFWGFVVVFSGWRERGRSIGYRVGYLQVEEI